jgi:hypothetical protein
MSLLPTHLRYMVGGRRRYARLRAGVTWRQTRRTVVHFQRVNPDAYDVVAVRRTKRRPRG